MQVHQDVSRVTTFTLKPNLYWDPNLLWSLNLNCPIWKFSSLGCLRSPRSQYRHRYRSNIRRFGVPLSQYIHRYRSNISITVGCIRDIPKSTLWRPTKSYCVSCVEMVYIITSPGWPKITADSSVRIGIVITHFFFLFWYLRYICHLRGVVVQSLLK